MAEPCNEFGIYSSNGSWGGGEWLDLPAITVKEDLADEGLFSTKGVVSAWKLSPEELEQIASTGVIYLAVQGAQPPVSIATDIEPLLDLIGLER